MLKENIDLKEYTSYKIGGKARYFAVPETTEDLISALQRGQSGGWPVFILGGGTNLLISDKGFDGLVIHPKLDSIRVLPDNIVRVGAGLSVADFLEFLVRHELAGFEWAGGLPGTIGGAIRGNAGAFGGEVKDSLLTVASVDIGAPSVIIKRNNEECGFSYRSSIFKKLGGREIILEAEFQFVPGSKNDIRKKIEEKIAYRKERHPMEYPNVGSIFKNVAVGLFPPDKLEAVRHKIKNDPFPVVPTAVLVSLCDLKGTSSGGAMVSPKHPNFIINAANAKSSDVENLINIVKREVKKKFGVDLEEEIVRVDSSGGSIK